MKVQKNQGQGNDNRRNGLLIILYYNLQRRALFGAMIDKMPINVRGKRTEMKRIAVYLLKVILLPAVYHLAARLGPPKMAYVQINTSPVWPPSGTALAATRMWSG